MQQVQYDDFEIWMDKYQGYDIKTTTMYLRTMKQFVEWLGERGIQVTGPETITAGLVRDYRSHLAIIAGNRPSTINKALQVIRIYCRWGIEEGLIRGNPALKVQYIEEPLLAPKSLSESQVNALRSVLSTKKIRLQAMVELGLSAGLRVSEVTNLKISDLKLLKKNGEIYVRVGKGFKFRTIPIAPDLVDLLKQYLSEFKWLQREYVFVSQREQTKLSARGIQKHIEKLREEVGIDFSYHTLRHTYCTDLLNSGMKLTDVAIVAGHLKKNGMPNIATTSRYVMSRQNELAKAVRKMARWRTKRVLKEEDI